MSDDVYNNPEMDPTLHGFMARIPLGECDSPSRRNMVYSQFSQHVLVEGTELQRILTGTERESAKYTHAVTMPCDAVIRKIINKYPKDRRQGSINPTTIVIYENVDKPGCFGLLEIPHHFSLHYQFGFQYNRTDAFNHAQINRTIIPSGTRLAQSPSIDRHNNHMVGVELNAVFLTKFSGIEDGCVFADDLTDKLATRCYQTIKIQFGKNSFPLNKFGDENVYKCLPEIGSRIGSDCMVMAVRRSDDILNAVTTDPASLREFDHIGDVCYFANQPYARVVDIDVIKTNVRNSSMLTGMDTQLMKYYERNLAYYKSIVDEYRAITKEVKNATFDKEFNRFVRTGMALIDNDRGKPGMVLTMPKAPLDEWTVTIKLEYLLPLADGSKGTCYHGGKFVFTSNAPREDMPLDEYGVRADIVLLDEASANRMNVGRDHQRAITAVSLRMELKYRKLATENGGSLTDEQVASMYSELLTLYWCVSEAFHNDVKTNADPRTHVEACLKTKIHIGRALNEGRPPSEMLELLDQNFDIRGTPITYRACDGKMTKTKNEALIAPMQFIILDKVSDVAAATSSARMQHFNTPANFSGSDKVTTPYRDIATKIMGEVEGMMVVSMTEEGTYAETLDQTTNAISHTEVAFSILEAENPMDIDEAVDRDKIPLTGGRPLAVTTHMIQCSGIDLKYREDE